MSALWLIPAFITGVIAPFALMATLELVDDIKRDIGLRIWKRRNFGKWVIHSHAGNGSDYSNGGRYTIYRVGYWPDKDGKFDHQYCRWEPPMKNEQEALAECKCLNDSLAARQPEQSK